MMQISELIARLDAFLNKEDFSAARALLEESLTGFLSAGDLTSAVSVYNELMGFERQYGSKQAGVRAAQAALELLEREGLADSRPAAMVTLNAATVYASAGQREAAAALYDKAEALFGAYYPAGAKEYAGLFNNRASVYLTPGEFPKAEYYYTRALRLLQRLNDVCDAAVTYYNLAALYARWPGREKDASAMAAMGARTMEVPENQRDGYYYYTCRKCAAACLQLGDEAQANAFTERADAYYAGH